MNNVKNVKVDKPKASTVLTTTDSSFMDDITNFFSDYSIEDNSDHLLIGILVLGLVCLVVYKLYVEEGFMAKQNIDFNDIDMYYINLDRSTKRKSEFERHCKEQDIQVKRYSAIDGRKVPPEIIEQVLGHPRSKDFKNSILVNDNMYIGHFGCFLSHIGVYQAFMESDKPYCLIFEDDAEFKTPTFKKDVNRHMGNVPYDWDIVLFGFHTADDLHHGKNQDTFLKNDIFHNLEHFTGLHGYLINKNSCKKLLDKLLNPQWYLDWAIADLTAAGNFKVYAVFKPLVCQPACYTMKFDNKHMKMNYIQDCKHGGGMTTTFSE